VGVVFIKEKARPWPARVSLVSWKETKHAPLLSSLSPFSAAHNGFYFFCCLAALLASFLAFAFPSQKLMTVSRRTRSAVQVSTHMEQ
jgi:hypothetical protein